MLGAGVFNGGTSGTLSSKAGSIILSIRDMTIGAETGTVGPVVKRRLVMRSSAVWGLSSHIRGRPDKITPCNAKRSFGMATDAPPPPRWGVTSGLESLGVDEWLESSTVVVAGSVLFASEEGSGIARSAACEDRVIDDPQGLAKKGGH